MAALMNGLSRMVRVCERITLDMKGQPSIPKINIVLVIVGLKYVELGPKDRVIANPRHPYSKLLIKKLYLSRRKVMIICL